MNAEEINELKFDEIKDPSKALMFFSRKLLDISNKRIISKSKKDPFFNQFVENFRASIQFSTKEGLINKYIIFKGNGEIEYSEGILDNPDATILYRSVKDMYIMYRSFGDISEGLMENRFVMKGNLNILFKYGFLLNYINPKKKKIKPRNKDAQS